MSTMADLKIPGVCYVPLEAKESRAKICKDEDVCALKIFVGD